MTDIYDEHMNVGENYEHKRFTQMREQDLKPEYEAMKVVSSSSNDHAYLVSKVSVLTTEFENADVVEDRVEKVVCGCDDYWFRASKDFENGDVPVENLTTCKHATVFREERVANDDSQEELV